MIGSLVGRASRRLRRELVERMGVSPKVFGYRYLPADSPESYLRRAGRAEDRPFQPIHVLMEGEYRDAPLPRNVSSRDVLSKDAGPWGYSLHDVPGRYCRSIRLTTVQDCRVVSFVDANGYEFYSIITPDSHRLQVRGTDFMPEHAEALRDRTPLATVKEGVWIFEHWYANYYHWMIRHLPKLAILQAQGLVANVLLPHGFRSTSFIDRSLSLLGVNPAQWNRLPAPVVHVGTLTVVEYEAFSGATLRQLRERLVSDRNRVPFRRIFISRSRAERRRLDNEVEVWTLLRKAGYERVFLEELDLDSQIALMAEARVVLGVHGAGLTNMLFCPPGTHIVEISDLSFPSPDFYDLASLLGHRYWLLYGEVVGECRPLFHDISISISQLEEVIQQIEHSLEIANHCERRPVNSDVWN